MIPEKDTRTALIIGEDGLRKLRDCHVAVVGLGGVGGYAVEALARAGVGRLTLVDHDIVQVSNLNRQIIALKHSVGEHKTSVMRDRVLGIDPQVKVDIHQVFADGSNYPVILRNARYLVDAIDSLEAKIGLIEHAYHHDIKVVSVFGAGNRLDPSQIRTGDIASSSGCPLARRVRKALRERGISSGISTVYSIEEPHRVPYEYHGELGQPIAKRPIGSISYMPGIMGLWAAAEIIRLILATD